MKSKLIPTAVIATAALALPGGAAAADIDTAVKATASHTAKADKALTRAVSLFEAGRDAQATRALKVSRREMGLATAAAKRAGRGADNRSERARAARATERVADQQDENIEKLVGILDEADGRAEKQAAAAALADTRGRDKAIAVLAKLADRGVSSKSAKGIARALEALAQNRDEEVEVAAEALASDDVSSKSKSTVTNTVEQNVEGQAKAGAKLAELLNSDDMPEAAKQGLQTAYDAVTREQESSAQALDQACERMPAAVCESVRKVVAESRANAQEMRDNHPTGQPAGTPSGQPTGTPTGDQSGGDASSTPTGAPSGTPAP